MSDFDLIEYGYNIADETINFGTRNLADGDNLHEAATLATLKCSKTKTGVSSPHINAVIKNGSVYFNIHNSMKIFKDKECSEVVFDACFDAIIDTFVVRDDYFLVCLRNGTVHLINCREQDYQASGNISVVREFDKVDFPDGFFINSFLEDSGVLVVTKMGQVIRIKIQNEDKLEAEHVYDFSFTTTVASFRYPSLLVNGTKLAILDVRTKMVISDDSEFFQNIYPLDYMFLALDFEGNLFRICALTLLVFPVRNSTLYKDFLVASDSDLKHHIIAVTKSEPSHIQLLSYPEFNTIYSLKLTDEVLLITPESLNDELLYISKISDENGVNELRFRVVYETEPEQRLQRLLKKHKYEEAEKFAKLFNLDLTEISKAKVEAIVHTAICDSKDVDNLISLLDSIDDDEFKLQACLDVESSCLEDVRKILKYGCNLPLKKQNRQRAEELQTGIINLMFKFDTFSALYREDEGGMQSWLQFAACNMISELKSFLQNCQIEQAKIIYSRLDELTIKTLTEDQVADVLAILNNIPISTYEQFLPIFIPITLSILPSTLPLFVKWIYNKVFHLEKRSKADFPNNAIGFTENIVLLIRLDDDVNDISFQRECTLHRESFNELSLLLSTLKRLKLLKDNYRITIPLSEYLAGPKNVIRILLIIEMCPEDFASLLKNFLSPFMLENHLEPNEIFLSEITDLMKYQEQYWVNIVSSILNCISSVSVKLAAVKTILDTASVPWCATVRQIAYESLKYYHPLVSKIKELVENEPMQVVLRKPKYKIKEKRITDIDAFKFVIGRVMRCRDENMIDDVYTLCKTKEEKHIANILLITRLIQDGRLEKAVELLNDNTPEERINCAKEIANSLISVLNNEAKISDELRDNCYEIAGAVFQRLIDDAKTDFERTNHQETLNLLKNVRHLYENFKIRSSIDSLKRCKDKIVEDILEETRESFDAGKVTPEEVFSICHKLSGSLSLDEDELLLKFCEKSGDYGFIFKAAARVSETEASSRSLCLMAVLLLKYLGTYKLQMLNDSSESESAFIFNNDSDENDVFYDGLRLADEIAAKAVFKATAEELGDCIEVAFWVNTSFYCLKSDNGDLRKKLFGDVYDVQTVIPGFLTFSCIRNTFDVYTRFIQIYNYPGSQYLTHFKAEAMTEDDLLRMVKQLPSTIENLCKEGQHFTSYKVASTLLNSLLHVPHLDEKILIYLHGVVKKHCLPKLLASILSNNMVNEDLLFSLLLFCEREDSVQFVMYSLRMYKRHPRKFASIIRTGLRFWRYHDLPNGQKEMTSSLVTLKWWKRFEKKKFEYDHFFKTTPDERFQLLINADCLDQNLIEEYAEDYELSVIVCYSSCLKRTILNWKPDYEVKTDIAGKRHLLVKNDEDVLLKKCQEIMKLLDKEQILNIIHSLWVSVNKYYYEVLIAMFAILDEYDPKQDIGVRRSMLRFLKHYQRVSKPSEMETQNWYSCFPETRSLDPLSEFRLPFTEFLFTSSIWSIIRPEINLRTYKCWFDAIEILAPHLKQDDICSYVVKDVVSSGVLAKEAAEGWVLHSKHADLFAEIEECVGYISDLERTASVVYHLLSYTPEGADQVIAATLCYKYAVEYKKSKPNSIDVETAFVKVQKKYYNCHAIHILHTHQLAEEKYINLVTHPGELILALYSDERILKKSESVELHCPDINKATEALASLFNMDIKHIRHTMIENWLFDCPSSGFDFDSSVVFSQTSTDESDNLKRAAYVCCTEDIQSWQMYLHRIGLGEEIDEHKSVSCRARALKLFALISSAETIKEMTESNYDEFTTFIDKLTLVSNLEYLGISLDVEAFDQYNKKELLNRLAHRAGNQLTIKTMAGICMTYLMYDLKYWEFILNSSVKYSMFVELKSYVCFLKEEKYHNKHFYINAWQKLIEHAFMSLSTVRKDRLNDALVNNFLMIQSCPVLYSLKFDSLFKKCVDLGKVEFAAVLLQYVNSEKIVQFVREHFDLKKDLYEKLSDLSRKGIWGIHHVQAILAGSQQ